MPAEPRRAGLARASRRLARLVFGAAIVLSPFRGGMLVAAHPVPPLYAAYTDFTVAWAGLAAAGALALWAVSLAADRRPVDLGPRFLRWPALGLLAVAWVGVPASIDPALSTFDAAQLTVVAALAVYVLNEVRSLRDLAAPLATMVGIQALVGIAQVLGQHSVGLGALGELNLDPAANGVSVVATSATDRLLRAYGLADHPNILAGLVAFSLPLLAVGLAGAQGRRRAALGTAIVLGALVLFATFSRAGWLAAGVAVVVGLAMLARGRHRHALRTWAVAAAGAAVVWAVVAVWYAPYLRARADVLDPRVATELMSTGERAILLDAATAVFVGHPLGGTGLGTLPIALLRSQPGLTFDFQPAPVVVLDVAAELGFLGAICYGAILLAPWLAVARRSRRWTPDLAGASAALAAVTVVGFFDYYTWTFPPGRLWAWLLLGLWARAYATAAVTEGLPAPDEVAPAAAIAATGPARA